MDWHEGFVLRRRPWRETSLWLEAFTREAGKVALIARGARRRKRAPIALEPFQPLALRWRGRGEPATLTAAEAAGPPLRLDGTGLYCGFYLNELLSRLLARDDPHPALFDVYLETLKALAGGEVERPLRRFELRLLGEIGYAPLLDHEVEYARPVVAAARYRYLPDQGPVADPAGWLQGRTLLALARDALDDGEVRRQAKRLLRLLLDHRLQGRPLQSRRLFQTMVKKHEP
ncbi:DNA repair protein RecO [Methylomarinovum caldicuralii]|uniref:DNA repair protein RecO n=1 Tax=Methylomarinovum caldicuralii TaxID=438856 RepID=A0AAU9C6F9_9GAMM|nr:DNA repair protein RecO [Methylomarinovum caldicuralii]BCX81524.1 DNA repair protein RecO [Methylomarinovum caldicuralii]